MSLFSQRSHFESSLASSIFFFLFDKWHYFGLFAVSKPNQTLRDYFSKILGLPAIFSLFIENIELDLSQTFLEVKIKPFDEVLIKVNSEHGPNLKFMKIKGLERENLEGLISGILDTVRQNLDVSSNPNPRVDVKLVPSIRDNPAILIPSTGRESKPYPKEEKPPAELINNIIQTDNEKKLKTRVYVIEELIKTEENYLKSLQDLIEMVIKPCRELKYLTVEQEKSIFSNVETIANFSQSFLKELQRSFDKETFDPKTSLLASSIVKLQPFFRLYYPYCINFGAAREFLAEIRKQNSAFDKWLKNIEMVQWDQILEGRLLEPIQRMPRYVILMKELKKNTHSWHPDYSNIEKALKTFEDLNQTVNKNMEEYLNALRLFDLASKYGKHVREELVDPRRKFLTEEAMTLINDGQTKSVVGYFLTDMLLLTERVLIGDMKLIKTLHFGHRSSVHILPNTKHYSNLITLYGEEECLTFIFDSEETKNRIIKLIKDILKNIKGAARQRNTAPSLQTNVEVRIVGTVKQGLENFTPFVVYFIRIKYGKFIAELFLRYRELKTIDEFIRANFPDIKHPPFPCKRIFHQQTKTIEARALYIRQFLEFNLNSNAVKEKPEELLKLLSLPANFYCLFDVDHKENVYFKSMNDVGEKLLRRFSVFRVLFDFFLFQRPIYPLISEEGGVKFREREVEVELPNGVKKKAMINRFTKALDLCHDLSQTLGLSSWLDFKLVLEKSEIEDRILDDDELVFKALNIDEFLMEPPPEKSTLLRKMYNGLRYGKVIVKGLLQPNFRLKWRKCIFLGTGIEAQDFMRDHLKLEFVVAQMFDEIAHNKHELSVHDYCLFAALFAFINHGTLFEADRQEFFKFLEEKVIFKTVPINVLVGEKRNLWINLVSLFWRRLSEDIGKIVDSNRLSNEAIEEKIMISMLITDQKMNESNYDIKFKIADARLIARMMAIKYIMNSSDFGTKIFLAMYRKTSHIDKISLEPKHSCKLMIKYDAVHVISETSKLLDVISLRQKPEFNVFPDCVEIIIKGEKPENQLFYRFYSAESIRIYRFLELYAQIEILAKGLKKKYLKRLGEECNKEND